LHQGAGAFEIWSGRPAPLEVMRRALEENIYKNS
jgi:shikimate 5-dehydrogenase